MADIINCIFIKNQYELLSAAVGVLHPQLLMFCRFFTCKQYLHTLSHCHIKPFHDFYAE